MTKTTKIEKKKLLTTSFLSIILTFSVLASGLLLNQPQTASAFPTSVVATVFPNANGVGSHGVAVDSNGIVWYVPVGIGLIGQDPSFAPGNPAGILFRATPHPAVNNAIDNQDNVWISNSNGFVTKYDPVADSFTNFGPTPGCSFLDHIHFHSDGFVYTTCLDGNRIFQIDPVGGGIIAFDTPTANSATAGITGDVNGDLWTIERNAHNVARGVLANMVPNTSNGVTEFAIPNPPYSPETVKACGDKVWFTGLSDGQNGPRVDNIDINTLVITNVDVDPGNFGGTYGLAIDGNGNPFATNPGNPKVYGIDASAGNAVTIFATPSAVHHIAISPNGDLWYTDFGARIIQLVPDEPLTATCVPTGSVSVEKTWTFTDYNWDPIEECNPTTGVCTTRPANINIDDVLADPLPITTVEDVDKHTAFAQVHKNNKFSNTNPGAFYALTTIDVIADVDGLTVWENYGDCTEAGNGILKLLAPSNKPQQAVKAAIADPDGDVTEITGDVDVTFGLNDDSAHVEISGPIAADSTVYVLVKFQDDLKGADAEDDGTFDEMCDNNEMVDVLDDAGEIVFSTQADAALRISNVP